MMPKCLSCSFCLSGASIALSFDRPERMESYKNEKSHAFILNHKQNEPNSVPSMLNSFKKSEINMPHFPFEMHHLDIFLF